MRSENPYPGQSDRVPRLLQEEGWPVMKRIDLPNDERHRPERHRPDRPDPS